MSIEKLPNSTKENPTLVNGDVSDKINEAVSVVNNNVIAGITTDSSNACVNFNFVDMKVEIIGIVYVQTKTGYLHIEDGEVDIDDGTRWILYNGTSRELLSCGAVIPDYGSDSIYIIGALRSKKLDANIYGSAKFKINGASPESMYNPNLNIFDYVKGQKDCCSDHSIPVCDLYSESGINEFNGVGFTESDNKHPNAAAYVFISQQTTDFIRKHGGFTDLTGKTIGVFGGSFSVYPASQNCKNVWVSELGVSYTDYGAGGAGFASSGNYIDSQIDGAAEHDIYILWCSTNDAVNSKPIGNIGDTTNSTQYGGIRESIRKIIEKKPDAKILLFTSLKAYSDDYLNIRNAIR